MILSSPFHYPDIERVTNPDGTRFYTCPEFGVPLPSVTTILSATGNKEHLKLWEERVGKKKADRIREEATALGSLMHLNCENHIMGVERPRGNHLMRQLAARMADQIIKNGLSKVTQVWGIERGVFYPGLYAGMADLIGIHDDFEAIMDHKTAKKMRTEEMIYDYFDQLAAYALAHNEVYGTNIQKGVIFMVTRELEFKEFILEGEAMERHQASFLNRVELYLSKNV